MVINRLRIGYGGSLRAFKPGADRTPRLAFLKKLFWTYHVDNINPDTRSGWFLFQSLKCLKEKYKITTENIQVTLWGNIEEGNLKQAIELGIDELVKIEGYFPKNESIEKLNTCDMVFLPLESSGKGQRPLFIPGKLYEYLQIGKPILSFIEDSDCKEILVKSGLSVHLSPWEPEKNAEVLMEIMRDKKAFLSRNIHPNSEYIKQFEFSYLAGKLAEVFNKY